MFGLTPLNANHRTIALMIRIAPRPMLAPNTASQVKSKKAKVKSKKVVTHYNTR
jgi:hypothetical protein